MHFRNCHSYQGREANFEKQKKSQFSDWKMNIFGPELSKRALHSLGLIGPPLGGAIRPSKLSSFWSKILRWYRKSILPNQKYIKYCLPITDYLLAITSPNHIITHYLIYYVLSANYNLSSSSSGFRMQPPYFFFFINFSLHSYTKNKLSHLGSVNTSPRALAQ